jgi:hypothetical protein
MLFVRFYVVDTHFRDARGTDVVEKELRFARTGQAAVGNVA